MDETLRYSHKSWSFESTVRLIIFDMKFNCTWSFMSLFKNIIYGSQTYIFSISLTCVINSVTPIEWTPIEWTNIVKDEKLKQILDFSNKIKHEKYIISRRKLCLGLYLLLKVGSSTCFYLKWFNEGTLSILLSKTSMTK